MREDKNNIPIPEKRGNTLVARLKALFKGDSLLIPHSELTPHTRKGVYTRAGLAEIKITTRLQESGLRIWRTDGPEAPESVPVALTPELEAFVEEEYAKRNAEALDLMESAEPAEDGPVVEPDFEWGA